MKRLIVLSLIIGSMILMAGFPAPTKAQSPAPDDKPTFYHLVPGTYVNGWPRFTVHYPKDWVERPLPPGGGDAFSAGAPGPARSAALSVGVGSYPAPLETFARVCLPVLRAMGATNPTLVSDKPSQLKDGTPAREIEIDFVINGTPTKFVAVAVKKGDVVIYANMRSPGGKMGDDLKAFLYSLEFQPDQDEPVKVPPHVQEFLDKHCNDVVSHDVAKVMSHYSDRYLNSGEKKGEVERYYRQLIGSITSHEISVTDFDAAGDKAYLAGFVTSNFWRRAPVRETSIIKEDGEWKWYGNQREVVP